MATTKRGEGKATTTSAKGAKGKRGAPSADSDVLFLRNMPADVMQGLTAWVDELRAGSLGSASLTRTDLARDIITRIVRGQSVEPRRAGKSKS